MTKRIALIGAGYACRELLKDYSVEFKEIKIIVILDNDAHKWGEKIRNVSVDSFQNLQEYEVDEYWITSIKYASEFKEQLCKKYYVEDKKIQTITDINILLYYRVREKYRDYIIGKRHCSDWEMKPIIDYMKYNLPRMLCYDFVDDYLKQKIEILQDQSCGMLYVKHNNRRLYFSKKYTTTSQVEELYNCLCAEQDKKSPHKYLDKNFDIYENEVIADIGASEGMFILDNIDKIGFAYIFESDDRWIEALNKTFEPYKNKTQIIQGYISNISDGKKISLDKFFADKKLDFIKMDIEGEEINALFGAKELLTKGNIRVAACTYHNKTDYEEIVKLGNKMGFKSTCTKGYILCVGPWERGNLELDFRRGVVRLEKL